METKPAISRREYERMTTAELRAGFLIETLFKPGELHLVYWETDRTVIGSAVPLETPLQLNAPPELAAEYFCERRELGAINIGGPGSISVEGSCHPLNSFDGLYIGRGSRAVHFKSDDGAKPAKFYLISYPAHAVLPTVPVPKAGANQLQLGSQESANERAIFQMIHENGVPSCQLVMGFTQLAPGSVWNTMPPHTHARRSEVYLYAAAEGAVFHFMGPGAETRHLLVHDCQAVLSPPWSIHCGCGTRAYSFIWAMGGENQRFSDMDGIAIAELR